MKFRWSLAPAQAGLAESLARDLQISPLLAQCLLNRGLREPEPIQRFLQPRLKQLADPFLLPNMEAAVARLFQALERRERLVIFGDYDVDGVTTTAFLTEVLRALGWWVDYYLPHRLEEGYGLSRSGLENCLKQFPVTLLLAVDCGSNSVESIDWLQQQGIDVLVLDHHQVSSPPPRAVALVNPQLHTSGGADIAALSPPPFCELCSAGLAFKLAHALVKRGRETGLVTADKFDLRPYLELVALGTIADVVPLTGENRILVTSGLERLNQTSRPGLLALKEVAQISKRIGGYEVGFQLGPRLNAAGRLENALEALQLLLTREPAEARVLARRLDAHNRERQQIEREIVTGALEAVRAGFDPASHFVIVEGQLPWHIGVIGIVASRVLREFYRPTIILGGGEAGEWRGSGRSIEGFDLAAALRGCDDLLLRHGGHAMAAGLALHPEKLDEFRARFNELARRALKPEQLQPPLRLDAEVVLGDVTFDQLDSLDKLQQTGMGNPCVQLVSRRLTHQRPPQRMGPQNKHAKLWVTDGATTREVVMWEVGEASLPTGKFDLAFSPQRNEFNGSRSIQLKALDWKEC